MRRGERRVAVATAAAILGVSLCTACIQEARRAGGAADGATDATGADATGADADATGDSAPAVDVDTVPGECAGCLIAETCHAEGAVNPLEPCQVCDTARAAGAWSPVTDARACEDDDPCTTSGTCADGACVAPLRPECDDLPECVTDVVCTESCSYVVADGKCFIDGECFSQGDTPPGDPCRVCEPETPLGWRFTKAECDDGDPCTYEDLCSNGACVGQDLDCEDEHRCTLDFCDGGRCLHQVDGDSCLVGERCYQDGEAADDNECLACAPAVSRDALSPRTNGTCDDGDACTPISKCTSEGVCVGARQERDPEPNDTLETAVELPDIGAASGFPSGVEHGDLAPGDSDIFRWGMTMSTLTFVYRPRAVVKFEESTAAELCLYARCDGNGVDLGVPLVACADGDTESSLDEITVGCCRSFTSGSETSMVLDAVCFGTSAEGDAFVRLTSGESVDAASCGGYELRWGAQ